VIVRDKLFVDGTWVASSGTDVITVTSPVTEESFGAVPDATREDINRAVAAARRAFDEGPWPRLSVDERADKLSALAESIYRFWRTCMSMAAISSTN
jgi:acyl-CoA reductase-like NAD-dependent aldehyde dehydrogenase